VTRIRPDQLSLPMDDARTDRPLGRYYQDFSAALALVEEGFHGPIDDEGVPMVGDGTRPPHYDAIIVAQYALACLPAVHAGDTGRRATLRRQADWLVTGQHRGGPFDGFWRQRFDNRKYPLLRDPWVSALAQGNAISALHRAFELFGDDIYRRAATSGFEALKLPITAGGVRFEQGADLWLEEYPMEPAGHVFNGAIYALLGVLDHARATDDRAAWSMWQTGWHTVARHLDRLDTGFWSQYELTRPELVSLHYHKNIHIPQLDVLAEVTGDVRFERCSHRFRRYLVSPLARLRERLARRGRWRRTRASIERSTGAME